MKIIDTHIHFSNIQSFKDTARKISLLDYSSQGLEREFAAANVIVGIGMGLAESAANTFPDHVPSNPMLLDLEDTRPQKLACCLGINPMRLVNGTKHEQVSRIEQYLLKDWVVGLKIYAGYYPFFVYDEVYTPIYTLADQYQLPVVIHGGATYARDVLLKYSHPLHIDEVATKYRNVNFIVAHVGDPWVIDTAALVSKNPNLYSDLSGLLVKDAQGLAEMGTDPLITDRFREALAYTDDYSKFMFGSDWPLAPIPDYIEFVKRLIPNDAYEQVFYENALKVFPKLAAFINR